MTYGKMLYAGSFDPITNGHLDVIRRASRLCGTLIIGVLKNSTKLTKYTIGERIEMIRKATVGMENLEIDTFDGLLADYVLSNDIQTVVRGLRAGIDFEYEISMAQMNARLYRDRAETIFLMTDPSHSFISSSIVKEVFSYGGDIGGLVPPTVYAYMKQLSDNDPKEREHASP
ncbi:MAG: pantetheine-phosphate adenylyltransferase [Clostridiales Family XIII bacterium]|jgi:pantetheine-phosphate adenylyltransferase|nr:pantetheine-phosphate adenylyltransferase [Clostridiales Family XIII bacterium]